MSADADPAAIACALSPAQRRVLLWLLTDHSTRGAEPCILSVATVRTLHRLGLMDSSLGQAVKREVLEIDGRFSRWMARARKTR